MIIESHGRKIGMTIYGDGKMLSMAANAIRMTAIKNEMDRYPMDDRKKILDSVLKKYN